MYFARLIPHLLGSLTLALTANKHISGILSFFPNLTHVQHQHQIVLADNYSWPVLGKCSLQTSNSLSLPSRLYVLSFPFKLLFGSQLTKAFKWEAFFSSTSLSFRTSKSRRWSIQGMRRMTYITFLSSYFSPFFFSPNTELPNYMIQLMQMIDIKSYHKGTF